MLLFNHCCQITQLVEQVTRDSGGLCSKPDVDHHYFSHPVTFSSKTNPSNWQANSCQRQEFRTLIFKSEDYT